VFFFFWWMHPKIIILHIYIYILALIHGHLGTKLDPNLPKNTKISELMSFPHILT